MSGEIGFEKAFGDFIDRRDYDDAENALFSIVRICFQAGWMAAGGDPPRAHRVFQIYKRPKIDMQSAEGIKTDIQFEDK